MAEVANGEQSKRPRGGRPRLAIDRDAVADAVAALFAEGGYEAVTIVDTADKLGVSRATLYRAVPTEEDLLGILFERCTGGELTERTKPPSPARPTPGEQLMAMIRLQADAAVSMRSYLPVFFGGSGIAARGVQPVAFVEPPFREDVGRCGQCEHGTRIPRRRGIPRSPRG